jgi:hypothetical protein
MKMKILLLTGLLSVSTQAFGDVCDYRPSSLIGGAGASAVGVAGAGAAAAGVGAQAAGFYTLTHAVTGLTMLGSTAGGASAAGTVGIMGGTAGAVGTIAAVIMAPATIITGAVVGVGVSAYEGACYFTVERVEDDDVILGIVSNLASNSDSRYLKLISDNGAPILLIADKHDDEGEAIEWSNYPVTDLYIEEGVLRFRKWGRNVTIGKVGMMQKK